MIGKRALDDPRNALVKDFVRIVGVDRNGCQYVIPVQAKGGNDQLSIVQTQQDIRCCCEKFKDLVCRSISTQFMADDLIAVFELTVEDDEIKFVGEKHYRLVPASEISEKDLRLYAQARRTRRQDTV